jgi:hypothetical protein
MRLNNYRWLSAAVLPALRLNGIVGTRKAKCTAGFTGCSTGMRLNNITDFGFHEPISGQKKAPRKVLRLLQYFKHGPKD